MRSCKFHVFWLPPKFSKHISFRSHLKRIPVGKIASVHLKTIVMFGNRNHIPCPCLLKQIHPSFRIELFRTEHRNEILISELFVGAVCLHMMFKLRTSLNIHIPGIPLICKSRNTVHAPVNENSEFCVPEPPRLFILLQRFPGVLIFSFCNDLINFFQSLKFFFCHNALLLFSSPVLR